MSFTRVWLIGLVALLGAFEVSAQQTDAHQLYEGACAKCHAAHAGDFVFESLMMTGDGLVGRSNGVPVFEFLASGHGRISAAEVAVLMRHFTSIQEGSQLFQQKCYVCHQRAVLLSEVKLITRDGQLTGRYSGRDIADFLAEHGRLTPEEVPVILERLTTNLPPQNAQ
ncbi:hypothetical protein [Antarctobacter heliothermus]|uniref:Cytochrome c domain-containing protein n=1 Tax=Antarctobacter heliothermus TaxID=74033 RepID=A0A239BI13_9RHOB|nr:hypothetical protein [Antarctobacter heliothermus]SNS07620.1 hypothetical protein SAMN04488078_1003147 [Antarctobacter heliothermus]